MSRHLILAVHGIGEQVAGETVDQIVSAATSSFHDAKGPIRTKARRFRVQNEVLHLTETKFDGTPRNPKLYPAHLRRVTDHNAPKDEALFAEVFWADRSPAPKGTFHILFDLLWVLLGLGYLAMDNAEQVHGKVAGFFVHAFAWFFFGGVAAMNALLLLGSVVLLSDLLPFGLEPEIRAVGKWLICGYFLATMVGVFYALRATTFLRRVFWRGFCMLAFGLALLTQLSPLGLEEFNCGEKVEAITCLIQKQLWLLGLFWTVVVFLAVLVGFVFIFDQLKNSKADSKSAGSKSGVVSRVLYPQVAAAMVLLWMVVTSGLWLALLNFVQRLPFFEGTILKVVLTGQVQEALGSLSAAALGFCMLFLWGLILFGLRSVLKKNLYQRKEYLSRAILNPVAGWIFWVSAMVIFGAVWSGLYAAISETNPYCTVLVDASGVKTHDCNSLGQFYAHLAELKDLIMLGVLALGLLIYRYAGLLSGGLGVARDIVTYSVREYCYLWRDYETKKRLNYPYRYAIDGRFVGVLEHTVNAFDPDHITIVSHSQGTVIATQMLSSNAKAKALLKNRSVTLITMGSPVTHIYQRYFPKMFKVDRSSISATWVNIFRQDDFVGTTIEGQLIHDKRNLSVSPGGHTGYFTDHEVWEHFWSDAVGFDVFQPKRPAYK